MIIFGSVRPSSGTFYLKTVGSLLWISGWVFWVAFHTASLVSLDCFVDSCHACLFKVFTCTMLVERCMQSVSVTAAYLYRVGTATSIMAFILPLSVRFPAAAASKFLTIKSLHSFWLSLSIMGLRQYMSSPKCVQFEWVLSR